MKIQIINCGDVKSTDDYYEWYYGSRSYYQHNILFKINKEGVTKEKANQNNYKIFY